MQPRTPMTSQGRQRVWIRKEAGGDNIDAEDGDALMVRENIGRIERNGILNIVGTYRRVKTFFTDATEWSTVETVSDN
jgi:hypothetical protein